MSEKDSPNFIERFTIRMPDGMRDAIADRAKANGRSMNSEIIQIIQDALENQSVNAIENISKEKKADMTKYLELMMKIINDSTDDKPAKGKQDWYSTHKNPGNIKPE